MYGSRFSFGWNQKHSSYWIAFCAKAYKKQWDATSENASILSLFLVVGQSPPPTTPLWIPQKYHTRKHFSIKRFTLCQTHPAVKELTHKCDKMCSHLQSTSMWQWRNFVRVNRGPLFLWLKSDIFQSAIMSCMIGPRIVLHISESALL